MKRIAGHGWKTAASRASRYGKLVGTYAFSVPMFLCCLHRQRVLRFVAGERPLFGILPTTGT